MPHPISHCRVCGSADLTPVLDLGEQYLTGVFPKSREEKITRGPLELVKCCGPDSCGLLQLRHSFDSTEMYGANYGYRSSLNQTMVTHLRQKIESLLAKFPPKDGDLVLDIGSNDGTSLSFYPKTLTRVGMDPTAEKFRQYYQPGIEVITDFFSMENFQTRFADRKAAIVTSIAMFYDLEKPMAFMEQVRDVLADEGIWHFEQSYLPAMLEHNAYDTVCHEHLEYYGLAQIQWMAERCGLRLLEVELNDVNGGSFAVTVCKETARHPSNTADISKILSAEKMAGLDGLEPYRIFRDRVFQHRDDLRSTVEKLRASGASILGYGASTKGNVILQFCGFTPEVIPAIAEVNPDKFGAFTPGTHIPIISEVEAHARKPDYLLVMPWHFKSNLIHRETGYLEGGGRLLFPLPEIEVIQR